MCNDIRRLLRLSIITSFPFLLSAAGALPVLPHALSCCWEGPSLPYHRSENVACI